MSESTNTSSSRPENISRVAPLNEVKDVLNAAIIISIVIGVGVNLFTSFQGPEPFFLGLIIIVIGYTAYQIFIQFKINEWENQPYAIFDSTKQWSSFMGTQSTTVNPQLHPNTPSASSIYLGSRNSKIFHTQHCLQVTRILPNNRVIFVTVSDAVAQGYLPCQICKPR